MRKLFFIGLALALVLCGCGARETLETIADDIPVESVLGQMREISVRLPDGAVSPVLKSEAEQLYLSEDYEILVQTCPAGNLNDTIRKLTGFDKEQLTRDEILRQLDACRRGEITQEELTAGKEALLSSLRATSDSPGAIEGYYATAHLSGLNMTPERYMEVVEKVSLADVVAAARTVTLHSTYFLKGESQ